MKSYILYWKTIVENYRVYQRLVMGKTPYIEEQSYIFVIKYWKKHNSTCICATKLSSIDLIHFKRFFIVIIFNYNCRLNLSNLIYVTFKLKKNSTIF